MMLRIITFIFCFLLPASPVWGACVFNVQSAAAKPAGGSLTLNAPAAPATDDIWIAVACGTLIARNDVDGDMD